MATPAFSTNADAAPAPLAAWLSIDGLPIPWDDSHRSTAMPEEVAVPEAWEHGHYREWIIERMSACPRRVEIRIDGHILPPRHGTWYWTPEGAAGLYKLEAEDSETGQRRIGWVRVLPTTVSHDHFQRMIEEIQRIAYHLVFQASGGAREALVISQDISQHSVGLVEYHKLQRLMVPLASVLNTLRRDPREHLSVEKVRVPVGTAVIFQLDPPLEIATPSSPTRPREVSAMQITPSLDVFENQLVRHVVAERLPTKLAQIRTQLESEIGQLQTARDQANKSAEQMEQKNNLDKADGWRRTARRHSEQLGVFREALAQVNDWQRHTRQWQRLACVHGAGQLRQRPQPTPTLTREPRYRRFYQLYLALQRDLRLIDVSRFASMVSMRKQWQLYEIWSVLTLTQLCANVLLEQGYAQYGNSGLFQLKRDTFEADLDRGYMLSFRRGPNVVRIAYERVYESFKTATRAPDLLVSKTNSYLTPDLAIESYMTGEAPRALLFDAKYKHNQGVVVADDITKMQNYVNLIGQQNPMGGKPLAADILAIVVFPGSEPSYEAGADAGALPMEPGGPMEQVEAYAKIIEGWLTHKVAI